MTKRLRPTWLPLCLLLSAGCTSAPKLPTQQPTAPRMECSLVPCRLPARSAVVVNDDWRRALDESDAALLSCAGQVLACIERQEKQIPMK
ncbi:Uncharacterised protein [Aquipseudomonas alcaligenes]|nr:Uncharacterised protein [Pseudomonas alcaligenes]